MGAAPAAMVFCCFAPPALGCGAAAAAAQQQQQQQQQAQQLQSLCFYQNPEGTSSLGTACFWRSFRPSGPWCFAVSQPPTIGLRCGAVLRAWEQLQQHQQQQQEQQQQAQQLQSLCFYQNPEGTSSLGTACFWRSFRPSGPWCFAVSQPPARTSLWSCFEGMGAALWSWFLVGSEGHVRHWGPLPAASGQHVFGDRSVLQGHGVLLFRNRPEGHYWGPLPAGAFRHCFVELRLCCGALCGHGSCTLELVSCRFRRQRYALEPACWVPLPYFSAMVFCCLGQHVFGGRSVLQFPCGEGCVLEACSTSSSSTTSSSSRSSSSRPKGPAAELALFLLESRRDVKPRGNMFLEVVPSFSSMVFRCGEGCVLEACSTSSSSTTSSSSRSSSSGSSSSRPSSCNRFVLNRIQKGRQASGQHVFWRSFRPSVAWCFGVAKGAFWRLAAPAPAAPLAAAAGAAAAAGPAAAIALFLTESRRVQKGRPASGQHVFGGRSVLQ